VASFGPPGLAQDREPIGGVALTLIGRPVTISLKA